MCAFVLFLLVFVVVGIFFIRWKKKEENIFSYEMLCHVVSCHVVDEFTLHFYAYLQPLVSKLSVVRAFERMCVCGRESAMLAVNNVKETGFVNIFTPLLISRTKAAYIK